MAHSLGMFDLNAIKARLQAANVQEVARQSGVSAKTVYRIRDGESTGTVKNIIRIVTALDQVYPQSKKKAA